MSMGSIDHTLSDQGTEILKLVLGLCRSGNVHMGYGIDETLQRIQETDLPYLLALLRDGLVDEIAYQIVNDQYRI